MLRWKPLPLSCKTKLRLLRIIDLDAPQDPLMTKDPRPAAILTRVAAGANMQLDPGKEPHVPQEVSFCFHRSPGNPRAGLCRVFGRAACAFIFTAVCFGCPESPTARAAGRRPGET